MRSFLALLIAAGGCDSGTPAPTSSAAPAPRKQLEEPKESRFLADLGSREHPPAVRPPSEPVSIRFDFSGKRIYAFDYHQRVANTTDSSFGPGGRGPMDQSMSADGALLLKGKGDGTGTLILKDLKSRMILNAGDGAAPRSMELPVQTLAVPEVKEDGSMEGGGLGAQPLLKLLFPVPPKPLAGGESVEVPLTFPFHMAGSPLTVKGVGKITLAGFVSIEERTCARLDVEIDVSRLDVPEELEGKSVCSLKGRSVYYWDVEKKEFASGETALLMKMRAETRMPSIKGPENAPPLPEVVKMSMFSDNLLRITRNPDLAK